MRGMTGNSHSNTFFYISPVHNGLHAQDHHIFGVLWAIKFSIAKPGHITGCSQRDGAWQSSEAAGGRTGS